MDENGELDLYGTERINSPELVEMKEKQALAFNHVNNVSEGVPSRQMRLPLPRRPSLFLFQNVRRLFLLCDRLFPDDAP